MVSKKSAFCCDHPGLPGISRNRPAREHGGWTEGSKRKGLYHGREMKFVTRTGEPSEPHAFESVLGLEMGKAHLDALAFISRLEEALCHLQPSRHIAGRRR